MATTVNFTMFTGDKRILELTVKDISAAIVDISGATLDEIHWILQTADDNPANQVYKRLGSGIAFKTDGTDGKVQVTIDEADTSSLDAKAGDLSFVHMLSVEVGSRPAINMDGVVTIKHRLLQLTNVSLDGVDFQVTTEYPEPFLTIS